MEIDKVKSFFYNDKFLVATGVVIDEVGDDSATCSFEIKEMHLNAANVVQGGATYTLADSAFAVASNIGHFQRGEKKVSVSQSANITYYKPPKGEKLIAKAKKLSGGHKVSVFSIEVRDELGTNVALMIGNAYAVDLK